MKIAEAFVELYPQLDPQFASTVTTETTRAGERAGAAIISSMTTAMQRGRSSVAQEATRTGAEAGTNIAEELARQLLGMSSRVSGAANEVGQQAGQAAGEGAAQGVTQSAEEIANAAQRAWLNSMSEAAQRAGREAGQEAAEAAADGLDQNSNAIGDAAADAGSEAGESLTTSLRDKVEAGGALVGAALGAALIGAAAMAIEKEGLNNTLAAQLGAGPEMAKEFGGIAGRVYAANYGESLEDVNDALKQVWQNGLVDEDAATSEIEAITKKSLNLATVMGEDVSAIGKAISQMLKTGMADSAEEAFDILTRATQQGLNSSEDLLDTFNEYGTQFRKLGLDGTDAMGLISQGLRGGARDADIVADAFKEFSIRAMEGGKDASAAFEDLGFNASEMIAVFNKGGPEAKAALGEVVGQLNDMEDSAERNAIGVALFGTQWEDLGDAFKEFDVGNAAKELGDIAGAADKVDQTLGQGAGATLEAFKRQVMTTFVDVVGGQVVPIIMNVVNWLKEHDTVAKALVITLGVIAAIMLTFKVAMLAAAAASAVATTANALFAGAMGITTISTTTSTAALIANKVGMIAGAAASKVFAAAQWLVNAALSANPIGLVIIAIVALVAAIVIAYKNSETFRKIVDAAWKGIKKAIEAVVDWFVKNAMPLIKKWLELAGAWFSFLWKSVIVPVFNGIKKAIEVWWDYAQGVWKLLDKALDVAGDAFMFLWKNVIDPVFSAIEKIIDAWWTVVSTIFKAVVNFLDGPFKTAWNAYKAIVEGVWNILKALIEAWWNTIKAVFGTIIDFLGNTFKAAWETFKTVVTTVWNFLQTLLETWWRTVKALWEGVINFLKTIFQPAYEVFRDVVTAVWNAIELLIKTWWTVVSGVWNIIIAFLATTFKAAWDTFKALLEATWNAIQLVITTVWTFLRDQIFTPIITFLATVFTIAWNTFKAAVEAVWNAIQLVITTVWNFIRDMIFTPIMNFFNETFIPAWNALKDAISTAWSNIQTKISDTWNWIRDNIFSPIQTFITETIPNAFGRGVDAIGQAWDRLKQKVRDPVYAVVNGVINNGIIKGLNWIGGKVGAENIPPVPIEFARGGVLPGYTPGRDVFNFMGPRGMRLALSGGEAIMRPEFTRGVGKGFINFFNRIARTRGVTGVRRALASGQLGMQGGFADGGIVDWMKKLFPAEGAQKPWTQPYFKKAKGDGDGWVSKAWGALTDPADAFKKGVEGMLGSLPGGGWIKDQLGKKSITHQLLPKAIDWIKDKIKGIFELGGTTSSITPIGGSGGAISSYTGLIAAIRQVFPGYALWSGYRPGSKTLSGALSYHARGRAIDGPPIRAVAEWIVKTYGKTSKEIITPWRDLNWWHGRPHKYNTAVEAQHGVFGNNAHIHWAMKNGGMLEKMAASFSHLEPKLFDNGGYLTDGIVGFSRLNKPERVLTPAATSDYDELASGELLDRLDRLIDAVERVAPGVGKAIRGSTQDLVTKARAK